MNLQRKRNRMLKKLFLITALMSPPLAFCQTAAPIRPNHTLLQYSATNSNAGTLRKLFQTATPFTGERNTALLPPDGLSKDTYIPALYADGSSGTLYQIGQMADGSVQQSDVGNTIAPLDENKMMSASVIGDITLAPATGNGTTIKRNIGKRAIDFINMADSLILNGHGNSREDPLPNKDVEIWQNLRNKWGGDKIVILPSGYTPPSILKSYSIAAPSAPDPSNKNIFYFVPGGLNVLGVNGSQYGRTLIDTDNDTTISPFGGSLRFDKHTISAAAVNPIININYQNSSSSIGQTSGAGMYAKLPPINVNMYQDPEAYGSLTGISFWLLDQSRGDKAPMLNQSQIFDGTIIRDGRSSTWGFSLSHRDTTGTASNGFSQTYAELDGSANGPDGGNPVYSPGDGNRKGIWIQSGSENAHIEGTGKNSKLVENTIWKPNTIFKSGERIRAVATDGKLHLYDVTTAGTTGQSAPLWSMAAGEAIPDGTVKWTHLGQFNAGFSKAIFVDGNNYFGNGDSWFDTILTSNDNVYGAFIDVSSVRFIDPSKSFTVKTDENGIPLPDGHNSVLYNYTRSPYGAALRMAADMNIDFSADGTQEGLNKHRLTYSSTNNALEYISENIPVITIKNDLSLKTLGVSILGSGMKSKLYSKNIYPVDSAIIGSNLWNNGNNDTDILGGEGGLMLGVIKTQNGHPNPSPALEIQNNNHVVLHDTIQLAVMSKAQILARTNNIEGQKIYDIDDHAEVTYRCPHPNSCSWFPVMYGAALRK
ncbi:hypothetical protein DmAi_11150 [Acetobacter persici]|uniref:Uncharacterized protein n=2 Tax=Acetobacter persici TaxID=1076596 RepID=A0A6V8I8Y6_9PROT|nr:hypothetical protein DmAi_11150 [Acetobacter persici]